MKGYIIFAGFLTVIFFTIFLIPSSVEKFSLSPEKIISGEWWRFFTYQFVHLSWQHLIENSLGIVIISLIAWELRSIFIDFSASYFTAGIFSILPLWGVYKFTAAGASHAIFAALGFLAFDAKKFDINPLVVSGIVIAITAFIITLNKMNKPTLLQEGSHILGLFFGMGAYLAFEFAHKIKEKRKTSLLRAL